MGADNEANSGNEYGCWNARMVLFDSVKNGPSSNEYGNQEKRRFQNWIAQKLQAEECQEAHGCAGKNAVHGAQRTRADANLIHDSFSVYRHTSIIAYFLQ